MSQCRKGNVPASTPRERAQEGSRPAARSDHGAEPGPSLARGTAGNLGTLNALGIRARLSVSEEKPALRRKAEGDGAPAAGAAVRALRPGGGEPLAPSVRRDYESFFGADLSSVRIHAGAAAADASRSIRAQAFASGRDVYFGAGRYRPDSTDGRKLLAHELAHVVAWRDPPALRRREDPGAPVSPTGATMPAADAAPPPAVAARPDPDTRERRRITVVDFGENANLFNWREVITHIGEIEATSVDQMVDAVLAQAGDASTACIERLTLIGHGSPGQISVGDGTGWIEGANIASGSFRPSLARLSEHFCRDSSVVLYGCNVARGPRRARFVQALSDYWGVNVAAPTGEVDGFGIMGVWVWGRPGQVLPSDTLLVVDQIARILDETTYGDDEEMIFDLLETANDGGTLGAVRTELTNQGRWDGLRDDLIDEDRARYERLFGTP